MRAINVYFELTTCTKYNFKCVAIKRRVTENIVLDDDTDKIKKVYFTLCLLYLYVKLGQTCSRTQVARALRKPDANTKGSLGEFES